MREFLLGFVDFLVLMWMILGLFCALAVGAYALAVVAYWVIR